ncbi:MAG: hypothetical protein IJW23_10095 [Lentisphaeria bacterium]|nr:hypothetical protein [Lentisphaeria bacterium]
MRFNPYTSLLLFLMQSAFSDDLLRYYQSSDKKSYCAPVISNGTIYTQIDISGTQKQDVRYTWHGKKGSRQDMIPGVYIAGRRYNDMQRPLIPFGYFEESHNSGSPGRSRQVLDLGKGAIGCRNDFKDGLSIQTHGFVHQKQPIFAVRKNFTGKPAGFVYSFDYYYARQGTDRKPVKWCNYTVNAISGGAEIRYQVDGVQTLEGAVTILSSGAAPEVKVDGCKISLIFRNVPENLEFFMLYTDSFNGNDWKEEQKKLISEVESKHFDGLFAEHSAEWKKFWNRFSVELPDKKMQDVFYSAVYNLKCTSTPWGVPVGVHPYSWNGNYFGFNLFVSLFAMINDRKAAERIPEFRFNTLKNAIARTSNWSYSAGAKYPWQSDEEGFYECSSPGVWVDHIFHMGNIALEAWEYYRYTGDLDFLRKTAYPVIQKCAEFFMRQSIYKVENGKIIVGKCCDLERLGTARENAFLTSCSVICTLEIAAEAAEVLGVDGSSINEWRKTAAALRESLPSDGKKYLPFPGCPEKSVGVMGGLYPYPVLSPDDPKQLSAVNDYLGSTAEAGNMYPYGKNICTWYASWVANAMIRLGKTEKAVDYLQKASASAGAFDIIYEINEPGIFVSHPWCSAPPGCYVQGILELLCRAEKDTLLIGHGLETIWKDFSFTLAAPDDLTVTVNIKNGSPELLKISAGKRYSGKIQKVRIAGEEIVLKIAPGKTVTLKSARKDKKRIMEQ